MLSIIIPTYNRRALLEVTLSNLYRQTRVPDEVIVVDDHSTDDTPHYLAQLRLPGLRVLLAHGKGPGAARNTGLRAAQGEYIKFFDSDDVMSLNSLQTQYDKLVQSGADYLYSPYVRARYSYGRWQQADVVLQYHPLPAHMSLRRCMAYGYFAVLPSMLFRRSFLDQVGPWREDWVAYENWDYLWRIAQLPAQSVHTNECLMIYRQHGQQTTDAHYENYERHRLKLACLHQALKVPLPLTERLLLRAEQRLTRLLLRQARWPSYLDLVVAYKRLRHRYECLRTHTQWERMHGPCTATAVFAQGCSALNDD